MLIACVAGARPNFVKIKAVLEGLEMLGVQAQLIDTGQHYDAVMSKVFFEELDIRPPDHSLGVGSGSHATQTALVMMRIEPLLEAMKPDVVVVVGDVNSTLAAALTAAKLRIPVAHVEAGLRSRDWTMPEEVNRVVTDRISTYLFATSSDAVENLLTEGASPSTVHLVGNVMIDALVRNLGRAQSRPTLQALGLEPSQYGLITLHRPANVDDHRLLQTIIGAFNKLCEELPLVFPAHPRTQKQLKSIRVHPALKVVDPLGYLDFLALQASARLVLTDSGGVQEETTVLGIPCLTVRDNTERPITVTEGTNLLVGRDPERILQEARRVLRDGVAKRRPALWDGHAGPRIAHVLAAADSH